MAAAFILLRCKPPVPFSPKGNYLGYNLHQKGILKNIKRCGVPLPRTHFYAVGEEESSTQGMSQSVWENVGI